MVTKLKGIIANTKTTTAIKRCGKQVDRIHWGGTRQLVDRVAAQQRCAEKGSPFKRGRWPTPGAVSESSN
jgi:hypothetical protein